MTGIAVHDLAARRGDFRIFTNIDFALQDGESLVLTGRNGTGKSTLIRVISGLLPADAGTVKVTSADAEIPRAAEAMHYLGHRNAMKRELSVEENLGFWKGFMGDFAGGNGLDVEAAAAELGLAELLHLPFGYLSAGQQRRMAMAKLLVAWRPVWLLDEPTAALDRQSDALFARIMKEHLGRGGIIIAATHQELGLEGAKSLEMKGFEYHEEWA
ncbi:heme ABC exporter ATP-binding protein CcmA [Rhizobium sp.]